MVRKSKEDAEKTKEMLLDAAEHLFLDKGVAATSLHDIAVAAGVTRGAVYWHFKNKLDLFNAMHERVHLPMDELYERAYTEEYPMATLKEMCILSLRNLAGNEHAQRVYSILKFKCEQVNDLKSISDPHHQTCDDRLPKILKVFENAYKSGQLAEGMTPELAARALHGYMGGISTDYLRNTKAYDLAECAPLLVDVFFRGIAR